ncbi:MAG TPA: YetF domain-containing protein [Nannocystaceae bacterium]|nr:YetF domain-containing protein [Nannocystaceae bacterium]
MAWLHDIFFGAPDATGHPVEMAIRAALVFVVGIAMMRLSSRRFPGQSTPFDLLLAVVLGSVLSRTINGEAAFVTTLAACATLILAHWLFAVLAFRSHHFGKLVKGGDYVLVSDGKLVWSALDACHITERDLLGALRLRCGTEDVAGVRTARLERTGEISFILRE